MAVQRGYITANPLTGRRKALFQAEPEKNPTVLSRVEFDKVLELCPNDKWRAMCKIAYNAGLRRNEIVFLSWDDVDFDNEVLTIRNSEDHKTKSGKVRIVPMNKDIIDVLKGLRSGMFKSSYIFRDSETEQRFSKVFAKIVIKAEYTVNEKNKFSFHDLRRSFGTNLANKGISPKILQELLGHSILKTTMRYYVNADMSQKKQAVNMLLEHTA